MKRRQLFEFEDFHWFPDWLRDCMTRYINAIHGILGSANQIAEILAGYFGTTHERHIFDCCSGSGGPMPEVARLLQTKFGFHRVQLTLSDLYPNQDLARRLNENPVDRISYVPAPTDIMDPDFNPPGIRSLVCSMHHMSPEAALAILQSAHRARKPIFIYEISDNSFPRWLWWIAIPINIISVFFITPLVRPMSWQQLVFTYLVPILPLVIAWDGAVSNARTYTLGDLDILLEDLQSHDYQWEKNIIRGKAGNKLYLLGSPKSTA